MQNKILNFYYNTVPTEIKQVGDSVKNTTIATLNYIGGITCAIIAVVLVVMGVVSLFGFWTTRNEMDSKVGAILKTVSFFIGAGVFGVISALLFI